MKAVLKLYREARRRKVFRTGAYYVLGAWLLLQVADVLFPGFGIPDAAIQTLFWAAAMGLPVALVFGWLYEIDAQRIRRTAPADLGAPDEALPLARRDFLILAAFAVIAGVLVFRAVTGVREAPLATAPPTVTTPERGERLANSVAVLPFSNISNDRDNDFFCDGVSEEILDRLAGFRELTVIGRTSSFAFKGSDYGIDRISALLGVRYVLQGSVRKAGNQLRISAQLLDAGGRQIWNRSFDRKLENVFDIQSEIAQAVATTVASHITTRPDSGHQPLLEAYERYLTGRALLHMREINRAQLELAQAVAIDPKFAEAHAELAVAQALAGESELATRSVERALQLKPRLLRARAAQGFVLMGIDNAGAEQALREVLEQDPNMSDALLWLSNTLQMLGRGEQAQTVLERAALIDPLHPSIAANLTGFLVGQGRITEAERIFERLLAQPTPSPVAFSGAGRFYEVTGQLDKMAANYKAAALREPSFHHVFFLMIGCATLGDWELATQVNDRLQQLPAPELARIFRRSMLPALADNTGAALDEFRSALRAEGLKAANLEPFAKAVAGNHLARGRDYAAAIAMLEQVVNVETPYGWPSPDLFSPPAHALIWSYKHTGAMDKAAPLLEAVSRECAETPSDRPTGDSKSLHICAEAELLHGRVDSALDGLERAVAAGWRGYYLQERDPYWESVADHPRYRALMARVKADVDRQRAAVRRAEPNAVFIGKLDAAIAAAAR